MKKLLFVAVLFLIAGVTVAQRANNRWSSENVQTISGTITDNQRPSGILKSSDGTEYIIHLGPIWYWNDNNYKLSLSDATIKGNLKTINGENHVYPFTIEQNGSKIELADNDGIPKWGSRSGNRNGNGYGPGNGNCRRNGNGRGNCWRNK